MSALSIQPPYPAFAGADGLPLENGYIWIGTTNLNPIVNPINVYWDAALTVAAVQPIRTLNGYPVYQGTPARLYVNSDYSIQVQNRNGSVVYSAPAATEAFGNLINASQVVYDPAGTGAVATTVQAKLRESVSVMDFGAVVGVDMSTALQNAVNALPAGGGEILIGPGAWVLNTNPTVGTKSIVWNIDPAASWSGTGVGTAQFLSMATNPNQLAAGTHIRSQSTLPTPSLIGGIGAFSVEMLQPSTYNGSSVALYAGASSSSSQAVADVWAINGLVKALAGATGIFQCAELDVDTYAVAATTKGIGLNGVGNYNATVGIEMQRADATKWIKGIHILNALTGIQIEAAGLDIGLIINGPVVSQVAVSLGQLANFADTLLISRNTDTSPNGYYLRFVNAANTATLFSIDIAGSISTSGNIVTTGNIDGNIITGANFRANAAAVSASAGVLALGSATSTTATAGAQTLPANPTGFLQAYLGATLIKIPYYSA